MKRPEFQVGDIVWFEGAKAKVVECNLKNKDSVKVQCLDDGDENRIWDASLSVEINGLPVTNGMLIINGWHFRHDGISSCDIFTKGENNFKVSLERCVYHEEEGYCMVVGDSTYMFGNKIKYVHQLQHILFALGLDSNMIV